LCVNEKGIHTMDLDSFSKQGTGEKHPGRRIFYYGFSRLPVDCKPSIMRVLGDLITRVTVWYVKAGFFAP
jgi:hypothetical protein